MYREVLLYYYCIIMGTVSYKSIQRSVDSTDYLLYKQALFIKKYHGTIIPSVVLLLKG